MKQRLCASFLLHLFILCVFLFPATSKIKAIYCPPTKTDSDSVKQYTLVENSKCPSIDANMQCCYRAEAPSYVGYETIAGLSDAENPGLNIGGSQMCCPTGYSPLATYQGGSGQCAAEDLANMPPGSYNAITDCCKKIATQTVIPAGPGVPSYLLKGGVDITKAVPCSTVRVDYQVDLCTNIPRADDKAKCNLCRKENGVYTAIGCIKNSGAGVVTGVARFLLGTLGGIILIMILAASFKLTTSRGDPKSTESARSMIAAAISGAFLVLFSMMILQVIGVKILQLPGF